MTWLDPVFDRTWDDVEQAAVKIQEWKETGVFDNVNLKGCLNYTDMNRIEGNIDYIAQWLVSLGYNTRFTPKQWQRGDFVTLEDVNHIVNSLLDILQKVRVPRAPVIPKHMTTYTAINSIERATYEINRVISFMEGSFKKCGTFNSGNKPILPIWR